MKYVEDSTFGYLQINLQQGQENDKWQQPSSAHAPPQAAKEADDFHN